MLFGKNKKQSKPFRVAIGGEPADRPIPPIRSDLRILPQLFFGQLCFVIKDPVTLRYFRLQPAEHFLVQQLDGRRTARDLLGMVQQQFPEADVNVQEILRFVGTMHESHLLTGEGAAHAQWLSERRSQFRKQKMTELLSNFLFLKIPIFNPDTLLTKMESLFGRFIFSNVAGIMALLVCLSGLWVVLANTDKLRATPYSLLSVENLAVLWCVYVVTKIFHEFGHGLAAKHFGGEVSAMGVIMFLLTPSFYCDTSDAWMIPNRPARLWINAGGIVVELILAALAAWVWLLTNTDTIVNQIALNTMVSCSVATLVFNANPLMKYDGYYFIADLLEIPNLMSKSRQMLTYLTHKHVLGLKPAVPPDAHRVRALVPYAIASGIYRWVVLFSIVMLLHYFFDQYGLGPIGVIVAVSYVVMSVLVPFVRGIGYLWRQRWDFGKRALYAGSVVAAAAAVIAIIACMPWTMRIREPLVVLSAKDETIFVRTPGYVESVSADAGERVKAGQVILQLRDPSLATLLEKTTAKRDQEKLAVTAARSENKPAALAASLTAVEAYDKQLDLIQQRINDLTLRAPSDGVVISETSLRRLVGNYLPPGNKLCRVIMTDQLQARISLPQQKAALVKADMPVRLRLWSMSDAQIQAKVSRISADLNDKLLHPALASTVKGEVAVTAQDPQTGELKTVGRRSTVVIDLPQDYPLYEGMTGRGEITIQRTTVAGRLWRLLLDTTTPDWHL